MIVLCGAIGQGADALLGHLDGSSTAWRDGVLSLDQGVPAATQIACPTDNCPGACGNTDVGWRIRGSRLRSAVIRQ